MLAARSAWGVPSMVSAAGTGASTAPITVNRAIGSRHRRRQATSPTTSTGAVLTSTIPPKPVL